MGNCCSRNRQQQPENILLIPNVVKVKPPFSTTNHFEITSVDSGLLLLKHDDFPFPLQGAEAGEEAVQGWLDGLETFPFLKNVYWAWRDKGERGRWTVIEDVCEQLVTTVDRDEEICLNDISMQEPDQCKPSLTSLGAPEKAESLTRFNRTLDAPEKAQSLIRFKLPVKVIASQLAQALNHLHAAGFIHGNICPSSLLFHAPSQCLKLASFSHLQRISRGEKCTVVVGVEEAFRKPGMGEKGYFEEIDWYSFGVLVRWLVDMDMDADDEETGKLRALADDLITERIGTGPAVYSSQIKWRLE